MAAVMISAVCIGGCTHNDGDIGPWFGTWKLDSMTVDGVQDTEYADNVIWKFQANIMSIVRVSENHGRYEVYGTWCEPQTDVLRIEFIYSDNNTPAGTMRYSPLPETHLPPGISDLDILEMKSGKLHLEYQSPDGTVYGYFLTKW